MNADTSVHNRRNCSPYSPDELERFRKLLTEQQSGILQSCQGLSHVALRRSGDDGGDDSAISDDSADMASGACEQDLSFNFLGRAQVELGEIARAMDRIDQRSYGVCRDCGQAIPVARLEAIPTACSCVACKSKSESS